ncbi:hypothetical protein HOK51_01960 [Candidatus Woesearchaeota archaeon]|jgi:hypothetical protein|nr:hypothetical protein [Candidatus Woesearchaeota archaeon]MBT6518581.1 hypothetical protein [Candidatus Woesearchaeota archaeon]MBT7367446.1 hypothetical protein [Candidatus Woesearchaeota archaeon]
MGKKIFKKTLINTLAYGVVFHPIYSALSSLSGDDSFVEKLTNPYTFCFTAGSMVGWFGCSYLFGKLEDKRKTKFEEQIKREKKEYSTKKYNSNLEDKLHT